MLRAIFAARSNSPIFAPYFSRVARSCLGDWNTHKDALLRGVSDDDWIPIDHAFICLDRASAIADHYVQSGGNFFLLDEISDANESLDKAFSLISRLFPISVSGGTLPGDTQETP